MAKKKSKPEGKLPESKVTVNEKLIGGQEGGQEGGQLISSYKARTIKEKVEYTATPTGYVKCMALVDYSGMSDIIFRGDVILLPERRFKSLAYRGYVCEYSGDIEPIGKR